MGDSDFKTIKIKKDVWKKLLEFKLNQEEKTINNVINKLIKSYEGGNNGR